MSILGRLFAAQGGGGMERRNLTQSSFVPPPSVGVIDDFVGVHRAMANMTVLACVKLLADTIASLPWKAYRRDSKGVPKEVKPQPAIINQPYPGFDLFQWKWMTVASMALRGNAYSYITNRDKAGYPTALLPLHPDIVFLERRPDILMWFDPIYRIMGEPVPSDDMIHMRRFTMPGEPWGLSPIKQAAVAIGMSLSAEEYGYRYFKESANPSGILSTDQTDFDEGAIERLQQNWIQSHGGRRLPAFLTGGFKFQQISISPEESMFLETRQFQRSEICILYNVPPILIGDTKECVVAGTLMTMADGTRKPVEDLRVGEQVMAWDGSKLVASRVKWVGTPPVKPIVKVTTVRGRELICTADHPVLGHKRVRTPRGRRIPDDEWINAGDIEPGHKVRIALGNLEGNRQGLSTEIAYFLGAMVGDGHIRTKDCTWSNDDDGAILRMQDVVESLGGSLHRIKEYDRPRCNYYVRVGRASAIRALLNESGLVGTRSHDKFVPEMIMAGGPRAWRGFLSGYFDADGSIPYKPVTPNAYWHSTSRELLEGCQHLLALLGINSSLRPMRPAPSDMLMPDGRISHCRASWGLFVTGTSELAKLATILDVGHCEKRKRLAGLINSGFNKYNRGETFQYDRVKSVEFLGDGQTVGIEIENTNTHVTGGIITHNTTAWGTGVEQITLGAVTYSFRPWTSCIESVISNCLPRGQFVRFDYNSLLRGDPQGRFDIYKTGIQSTIYTPNEARAMEEMDPIEGGDKLFLPPGYLDLSTAQQQALVTPAKTPTKPTKLPMPPVGGGENSGSPTNGHRSQVDNYLGEIEQETRQLRDSNTGKHNETVTPEETDD